MSATDLQSPDRYIDSSIAVSPPPTTMTSWLRSEEHTSELQSRQYLVCRPLLEKKSLTVYLPPARGDARPCRDAGSTAAYSASRAPWTRRICRPSTLRRAVFTHYSAGTRY